MIETYRFRAAVITLAMVVAVAIPAPGETNGATAVRALPGGGSIAVSATNGTAAVQALTTPVPTNVAALSRSTAPGAASPTAHAQTPAAKTKKTVVTAHRFAFVVSSRHWQLSSLHSFLTQLGSTVFPWWPVPLGIALFLALACRLRESHRAIGPFLGLLLWHCGRFVILMGIAVALLLQAFGVPGGVGAFDRVAVGIAVAAWAALGHGIHLVISSTLRRSERRAPQPETTLPLVEEVARQFFLQARAIYKGQELRSFIGATRTIALFGEWGSGKSTFLRQLAGRLSSPANAKVDHKEKRCGRNRFVVPIFFDAWQAQSICPPEFALLSAIYDNPSVQRLAWCTKPWRLRWLTFLRSLRFTIRGLSLDGTTQPGALRRQELSLLSDAYRILLGFLHRAGVTLVILIDESDRCDRSYFQGVLNLVPRYLNADNCFVISAMVDSQLWHRLFAPLNAPESGEALLERYQLGAKEIDVHYAQPDSVRTPGAGLPERQSRTSQSENVAHGKSAAAPAPPAPASATSWQPRIVRLTIKGNGLLERFEPDLYDSLRAARSAGHSSQVDLQRQFLAKFFEKQFFLAPPAADTPSGASIADAVNRLVTDWTQRNLIREGDAASRVYADLLALSTFHGGLGANPRLIISALGSVLPLLSTAARSVNYDLTDCNNEDFSRLLRLALGLYCYLDRHPAYVDDLGPAHASRIADRLFFFATPDRPIEPEPIPQHEVKSTTGVDGEYLRHVTIAPKRPLYSEQRSPENQLACQVVFGISEDVADKQRAFAQGNKISALCNELCRVVAYSRRHLLSDTPADWDLARVDRAWDVLRSGVPERAISMFDSSISALGVNTTPEGLLALARALRGRGVACSTASRPDEAIAAYDEVVRRFGDAQVPALRAQVAIALVNKGVAHGQAGRPDDEITAYDEVVRRFGDAQEPALCEQVARALFIKGIAHEQAARPDEAIAACDEVVRRFGDAQEPALREQVASALVYKAISHGRAGRLDEAIASCDEVVRRFGDAQESALREQVARALVNKAITHGQAGRPDEAIAAYDEVVSRFGDAEDPALREQVASALVYKAISHGQAGRLDQVIAACDEVVRRFGDAQESALREQVARTLVNKGFAHGQAGRPDQVIAACDEVVRRFGDAQEPALREQVARALVHKGDFHEIFVRRNEAIAAYDEVVRRFGDAQEPALREQVARALVNKGITHGQAGRPDQAIAAYDEVVRRFGDAQESALREQVAMALVNKGVALEKAGRPDEAIAAYDEVVRRFGDAQKPALREQVASALANKGAALEKASRPDEAIAACDEVVRRFGDAEESTLREHVATAQRVIAEMRSRSDHTDGEA